MRLTRIAQSLSPRHKSAPHRAFARTRGRSVTRWTLVLAFVGVVSGIFVVAASASKPSFNDSHPCPEYVCPDGEVGKPYTLQLDALGGCDEYIWRTQGSLPAGLSMSTSSGLITGTPQAAGRTVVTIEARDRRGPMGPPDEGGFPWCNTQADDADPWTTKDFVFNIQPGLAIANQSVPAGMVGTAYSQTLTAMNVNTVNPFSGTPATGMTWSVQSGTLPAGVTLSSSGALQGTPTAVGTSQFVVRAQSGGQSDTETLTLLVVEPLDIAQPAVGPAEVAIPFSLQLQATGGGPPGAPTYKWSLATGAVLPTGLTLNPDTGLISGTPTVAGSSPRSRWPSPTASGSRRPRTSRSPSQRRWRSRRSV